MASSSLCFLFFFMPAVYSCRAHLARVARDENGRMQLYTIVKSSQFWCATWGDSQVRHETLWLMHHGLLKKRDFNEARHECWDYTSGSKARRVFLSTFSLLPRFGFPRRECTAGMTPSTLCDTLSCLSSLFLLAGDNSGNLTTAYFNLSLVL